MMRVYLKTKLPDTDHFIYSVVTGVKTFEWNGKRYWIWHKERGKWYLIDYDTGMTIIQASTRYGLKEKMESSLWQRLQEVYKTDYYKKEVIKLDEYRKADAITR